MNTRRIIFPQVCVVCNEDLESTWHIFVSCSYAKQCWVEANVTCIVDQNANDADGFTDWLFKVLQTGNKMELGKLAAVLWEIWRQRNNKLWTNAVSICGQTVFNALDFLYTWLATKQKRSLLEGNSQEKPPIAMRNRNHRS